MKERAGGIKIDNFDGILANRELLARHVIEDLLGSSNRRGIEHEEIISASVLDVYLKSGMMRDLWRLN